MANPHRDSPKNRKVEELADRIHDITDDINECLYSDSNQSFSPFIKYAEEICQYAEQLRAAVRRWSETGRDE